MRARDSQVPVSTPFDQQYAAAENKPSLDYWAPLAQVITECIEARSRADMSQEKLAAIMKTKQSVISRFENMDGRLPSYDFIARLSIALGHSPGMTLFGDFTATVPPEKHELVQRMAAQQGVTARYFLEQLLISAIEKRETASNETPYQQGIQLAASPVYWVVGLQGQVVRSPAVPYVQEENRHYSLSSSTVVFSHSFEDLDQSSLRAIIPRIVHPIEPEPINA